MARVRMAWGNEPGRTTRRIVAGVMALAVALGACQPGPLSPSPGGSPTFPPSPTAIPGSAAVIPTPEPSPSGPVPTATARPIDPPTASPVATPTASPDPTPTRRPTPRPTQEPQPTARPTPRPTAQPRPTPTSEPPSILVRHGSRTEPRVALTFDMGGRVGDAREIVQWLIDHDVDATLFMTGSMVDSQATDAGREVLERIEAHPGQLLLGNHSYHHPDFRDLGAAQMLDELQRTEAAIRGVSALDPRPWFRPPYGGSDAETLATVGRAGYRYTVLWDVDTIDWRPIANDPPGPTADEIVRKVLDRAQSGSIVLMHLGGYETLEALPAVVSGLRDRGYDLVTLDALLAG